MSMQLTPQAQKAIMRASAQARLYRQEHVTPEHLLLAFLEQKPFVDALHACSKAAPGTMRNALERQVEKAEPPCKNSSDVASKSSYQMEQLIDAAITQAEQAGSSIIDITHLANAMLHLQHSWAAYCLAQAIDGNEGSFITALLDSYEHTGDDAPTASRQPKQEAGSQAAWQAYVLCINDHLAGHNPLIGRTAELERTIQVLCRRDKNNPLHLGEPGVGKTAIVYGLAARIEAGEVPSRLKGCRIYQLDMGTAIAGTKFRGEFEQRLQSIMKGAAAEGNAIIYIDEIHNIVGAGQTGEGSLDASNMLKPYLEAGEVRFIGATTYEEYNRFMGRSKGLMRRFQTIDIAEPTVDDAIKIVTALKPNYESFHHVRYTADALDYAVRASARFINDRFLPDKAIDLIDEAGAYVEMKKTRSKVVDKQLVARVLARVANIDALAVQRDDTQVLASLMPHIKSLIYGQDEAVKSVVEAVQLSKAGLNDVHKPLASLLFVGPTGVGKTEVARVLAQELGVKLVRFDMSEYVEKHTVAKLIGSPAGYVGYDDGGLLTDAIRRSPDCVLLLDEIEKAHSDVFDILLQVMDYGVLTDNKGRKAYFHNVILIMTSNDGAQYASQASLGFASTTTAGSAMLKQVKHTFKPEFLNRLNGIIVFNDMDQHMASLVLDKKLRELKTLLKAKNVTLQLSKEAHDFLLKQGYSKEYGAREMDRAIERSLKTVLMREILFGSLKDGGRARVVVVGDELELKK